MDLTKIVGSLSNAKIMQLIGESLADLGLDFAKHIVACTTDETFVVVKFGKEILAKHQHCLANAIHLAISSAIYKKKLHIDHCEIGEVTEYEEAVLVDDSKSSEMSDEEYTSGATSNKFSKESEEENEDLGNSFLNILILRLETNFIL